MAYNDRYEYSAEQKAESKHNRELDSEMVEREEAIRPAYLNDLETKKKEVGLVRTICALWMGIEQLVPGRANRIALGRKFSELQRIYSEKNIGGDRRTSGHGTFEKECEQRGYPPRTVRGWIADYKAGLSGAPTEAQKRSARQQRKESAPLAAARTSGSRDPEVRSVPKEDAPTRAHLRVLKSLDVMGLDLNDLQTATIALLETGVAENDHLNLIAERCDRIRETLDVIDRLTKGKQTAAQEWTTPEITTSPSTAVN